MNTGEKRACNTCDTVYDYHSQQIGSTEIRTNTFTIGLVAVNFTICYICHQPLTLGSTYPRPTEGK